MAVMFAECKDGRFRTFLNSRRKRILLTIDPKAEISTEFQEFAKFTPSYQMGRWSGNYDMVRFSDRRLAMLFKLALT